MAPGQKLQFREFEPRTSVLHEDPLRGALKPPPPARRRLTLLQAKTKMRKTTTTTTTTTSTATARIMRTTKCRKVQLLLPVLVPLLLRLLLLPCSAMTTTNGLRKACLAVISILSCVFRACWSMSWWLHRTPLTTSTLFGICEFREEGMAF